MTDTELATQTYVAGYPLVVSVRTLQRLGGLVGVNRLFWQNALAGPQSRTIVAPNRDTLYSIAVLDLRAEPMVLTLPEVTDRYFTYQFLDAWTESFAYVGTRATGGPGRHLGDHASGLGRRAPGGRRPDRGDHAAGLPARAVPRRRRGRHRQRHGHQPADEPATAERPHRRPRSPTAPAARRTCRHAAGHPRRRQLLRRAGRRPGDQPADDRRPARALRPGRGARRRPR